MEEVTKLVSIAIEAVKGGYIIVDGETQVTESKQKAIDLVLDALNTK